MASKEDPWLPEIPPGSVIGYGARKKFKIAKRPETIEIRKIKGHTVDEYWSHTLSDVHRNWKQLKIENVSYKKSECGGVVSGEIVNKNNFELYTPTVSVLYKDKRGELSGGNHIAFPEIKPNSRLSFTIKAQGNFTSENFEIFVTAEDNQYNFGF